MNELRCECLTSGSSSSVRHEKVAHANNCINFRRPRCTRTEATPSSSRSRRRRSAGRGSHASPPARPAHLATQRESSTRSRAVAGRGRFPPIHGMCPLTRCAHPVSKDHTHPTTKGAFHTPPRRKIRALMNPGLTNDGRPRDVGLRVGADRASLFQKRLMRCVSQVVPQFQKSLLKRHPPGIAGCSLTSRKG